MKCGLLGRKLGHSYSPLIHRYLGSYSYALFENEPEDLEGFLQDGDFTGLNVTIPYKKEVIAHCKTLSPVAQKLGAVNTIIRNADGSLTGHNTDYFGFLSMLQRSNLEVCNKKVLVLGSGGASATVTLVLKEAGALPVVISRSGINNYDNLNLHQDASLIVNTTPVGMYPNVGVSPVDLSAFPNLEGVLDVVYNPAKTQLLLDAEKLGITAVNGLWMLVAQAKESAQWFTGSPISDDSIRIIYERLKRQMENIVLIGMPGCGKSTIGQALAQQAGKRFVDADTYIEQTAGKTILQIFSEDGEGRFRELETQVLAQLGKESGLVIATGGGCVTRKENYPHLHQNGSILWIQRNTSLLPKDGRPISLRNDLDELYRVRKPMYEAFADHSVVNDSTLDETLAKILAWRNCNEDSCD